MSPLSVVLSVAVGYMAFVFISESLQPFMLPKSSREQLRVRIARSVGFLVAIAPVFSLLWPQPSFIRQFLVGLLFVSPLLVAVVVWYRFRPKTSRPRSRNSPAKLIENGNQMVKSARVAQRENTLDGIQSLVPDGVETNPTVYIDAETSSVVDSPEPLRLQLVSESEASGRDEYP